MGSGPGRSGVDYQYVYAPGASNGQITQTNDRVTGEQVVYQYDSLKRLVQAQTSGTGWGQSFGYDGWGNLLTKTPTAGHTGTSMSLSVDPSTNYVTSSGFAYDLNGNMTSLPGASQNVGLSYDVENRTGGTWYDIHNQPLNRAGAWNVYGLHGERLETDSFSLQPIVIQGQFYGYYGTMTEAMRNIYFAGRLIQTNGLTVLTDRQGSVRANPNGEGRIEYYPYGETLISGLSGDLFATYTRDATTGLDYAQQRYYASMYGRFTSPDRSRRSAQPRSPGGWNAYAFVDGDPINKVDPKGRFGLTWEYCSQFPGDPDCYDGENLFDFCNSRFADSASCDAGGGGGSGDDDSHPGPTCEQQLISTINNFVAGTPLKGEGIDFVDDSEFGGLNPYLLVAIAGAESTFGAKMPPGSNNPFGLLKPVNGMDGKTHYVPINYGDVNDAINAAVSTVDKEFVKGYVTVAGLYSGLPGAYCFGNCTNGMNNVSKYFQQLGGGNPNNSLNLLWPCND